MQNWLKIRFFKKCLVSLSSASLAQLCTAVLHFSAAQLNRDGRDSLSLFFTYKISPIWNRLPAEAVNSASVEQFKIELDKVIDTLI